MSPNPAEPPAAPAAGHPVYLRLTNASQAFARHLVLHELEQRLRGTPGSDPLARRVRHCVERGVPYFAPADRHYLEWADHVAALWAAVEARGTAGGLSDA
jgi:hypothetical protein